MNKMYAALAAIVALFSAIAAIMTFLYTKNYQKNSEKIIERFIPLSSSFLTSPASISADIFHNGLPARSALV
jgi:hypothetical protein